MKKIITLILSIFVSVAYATDTPFVPAKNTRVIVTFAAGGSIDTIFREFQVYTDSIGLTLIPEYRSGAAGAVGLAALDALPSDGNSIAVAPVESVAAHKILTGKDIDPYNVMMLHQSIIGFFVKSDSKINSVADVVSVMRTTKKGIAVGYSSPGQSVLLASVVKQAKLNNENYVMVNYKSVTQMLLNLISGELDMGIAIVASAEQLVSAGRLKFIAVDSLQPLNDYPGVPTLRSLYPNLPLRHGGSSIIVNSSSPRATAFWQKVVSDYKKTPAFIQRAKTNYYVIKNSSVDEVIDAVAENIESLTVITK